MTRITLLSGGVGGARMARGLAAVLDASDLAVVVNVGDDDTQYGVHVAADLDTVTYTLAGLEGPHGWGVANDTFNVMEGLETFGVDTTFRLGDTDLATCLYRTESLATGRTLSEVTTAIARRLGVAANVLPATDDPLRTIVTTAEGLELSFQDYFVNRRHRDPVAALHFQGADTAAPAPGVVDAIRQSEAVVIAPSNPPLSIWPILAVEEIRAAVRDTRAIAVSPLFGGKALKGPAHDVLAGLGMAEGNAGIVEAYDGLLDDLVVDIGDAADADNTEGMRVHVTDTRIGDQQSGTRLAEFLLGIAS